MPRLNPYRPEYDYTYDYEATPSGGLLFVVLIAAILLGAFLWANYASQPAMPVSGQVSSTDTVRTFAPHTTSPSTGG